MADPKHRRGCDDQGLARGPHSGLGQPRRCCRREARISTLAPVRRHPHLTEGSARPRARGFTVSTRLLSLRNAGPRIAECLLPLLPSRSVAQGDGPTGRHSATGSGSQSVLAFRRLCWRHTDRRPLDHTDTPTSPNWNAGAPSTRPGGTRPSTRHERWDGPGKRGNPCHRRRRADCRGEHGEIVTPGAYVGRPDRLNRTCQHTVLPPDGVGATIALPRDGPRSRTSSWTSPSTTGPRSPQP